jgi:hypothetical protein
MSSLLSSQVRALTTSQIVKLNTQQVAKLNDLSLQALTSAQLRVLSSSQVNALSSVQICVLTSSQFAQILNPGTQTYTPIVLDLDGNGVQTLSVESGVKFDLLADGQPLQTGWVGAGDGLLVMDRNQDGTINDGSELFGSSTVMPDGTKAVDGYQALAQLDSNHDGVIDSSDAQFAQLGVWVDGDADGKTDAGEVKSLSALNIAQLSLKVQVTSDVNNGNLVGLSSSYQTTDGVNHAAADVWFAAKALPATVSQLAQAIGQFAEQLQDKSTSQSNVTSGLAGEYIADGQLASTAQMVEAMRAFAVQDAGVRIAAIGLNTDIASASHLSATLVSDEKVKLKNATDANVSGLFFTK